MRRKIYILGVLLLTFFSLQGQSLWSKQKFPIMAFCAIGTGYGTEEQYKLLEDAGFNLSTAYVASEDEIYKHLKAASKTKVRLIIWCPNMNSKPEQVVEQFKKSRSLGGYFIKDEPGYNSFLNLSHEQNRIKAIDDKHLLWINLYPNYASSKQIETESYNQYIEQFIGIVKPQFVSFDHYGLMKSGLRKNYYENLELISKQCKINNVPFWAFVLVSEFDEHISPTKGTLSFQAYSNLAYGAKGLEYYTYRLYGDMKSAIVDANYQKMPIYDAVKELNSEIQFYSKYFIDDIVEDVTHFGGDIPIGSKASNHIQNNLSLISCDGKGFVVSSFSRRGRKYLLLVNKDYENAQGITISSSRKIKRVSYYKNERTRGSGLLHFVAQPGSIVLLSL